MDTATNSFQTFLCLFHSTTCFMQLQALGIELNLCCFCSVIELLLVQVASCQSSLCFLHLLLQVCNLDLELCHGVFIEAGALNLYFRITEGLQQGRCHGLVLDACCLVRIAKRGSCFLNSIQGWRNCCYQYGLASPAKSILKQPCQLRVTVWNSPLLTAQSCNHSAQCQQALVDGSTLPLLLQELLLATVGCGGAACAILGSGNRRLLCTFTASQINQVEFAKILELTHGDSTTTSHLQREDGMGPAAALIHACLCHFATILCGTDKVQNLFKAAHLCLVQTIATNTSARVH
mmetsp:Transcript_11819/g.26822  ORF Transcript_11819/g.26822 Transcript_11819/m.26822 type:complete len:292 (-) Transcript_11819:606-1481(-)